MELGSSLINEIGSWKLKLGNHPELGGAFKDLFIFTPDPWADDPD